VLRRCVCVDADDFARHYWGRKALLSRAAELMAASGEPAGFADLLSPHDADELLSRRGLRIPFLRIAQEGRVLPSDEFTGSGGAGAEIADQVLDEQVLAHYAQGATLVLQGLHRLWPPLIDFAGRLAAELVVPVGVNAYLTPSGNRGFATHYDTHDVFVLQVSGRKRWRVHEPVIAEPLDRQPWGGRADEVGAVATRGRGAGGAVAAPDGGRPRDNPVRAGRGVARHGGGRAGPARWIPSRRRHH
jgi:bifunctional lysine-specific demethylase and histidyl-hydroxylase NO66